MSGSIVRPFLGDIMMMESEALHESDADDEDDDCQPAKGIKGPCLPCADEVNLHNLTHLPFRAWCEFCVKGRAVSHPHYKICLLYTSDAADE